MRKNPDSGKQSTTQCSTPSCNPPGEYHSCTAFVAEIFGLMWQPENSNCTGYNAQFDNQVATWHTTAIVKNPLSHIACATSHCIPSQKNTHQLLVSRAIIRRRSQPTRIGYLGCCCKVHNSPGIEKTLANLEWNATICHNVCSCWEEVALIRNNNDVYCFQHLSG